MKIAIGSDHAGFKLKEEVKIYLQKKKISFEDFGCFSEDSVDYPVIAKKVALSVSKKGFSFGILVCGSGIGMAMAANKVKNIRAVNAYDLYSAKMSRKHNNANLLTLGGRRLKKTLAFRIVGTFLKTKFEGGRHLKRIRRFS